MAQRPVSLSLLLKWRLSYLLLQQAVNLAMYSNNHRSLRCTDLVRYGTFKLTQHVAGQWNAVTQVLKNALSVQHHIRYMIITQ